MRQPNIDERLQLSAGRLIAHATDREEFLVAPRPIKERYPMLWLFTYFTGRYPTGVPTIRV